METCLTQSQVAIKISQTKIHISIDSIFLLLESDKSIRFYHFTDILNILSILNQFVENKSKYIFAEAGVIEKKEQLNNGNNLLSKTFI